MGRDGWGARCCSSESPGMPASTFRCPPSLTLLAPYLSLIPRGKRDFSLLFPLKFLESWQDPESSPQCSNHNLVVPTFFHMFHHHTLEDARLGNGPAHTPILAQPSFSNASQLWSWCPKQRGFYRDESRWCEELPRSPGQAHPPCAQHQSTNQAPAVRGRCEFSGQCVCCDDATGEHFPRPPGTPSLDLLIPMTSCCEVCWG